MAFNCNVVCGSNEAEPPMQLTKELDLLIHLIAKLHFLMQLTGEMGPVNAIDSRVGPTNGNDD